MICIAFLKELVILQFFHTLPVKWIIIESDFKNISQFRVLNHAQNMIFLALI